MYVAVTRAEDALDVSYARAREDDGPIAGAGNHASSGDCGRRKRSYRRRHLYRRRRSCHRRHRPCALPRRAAWTVRHPNRCCPEYPVAPWSVPYR